MLVSGEIAARPRKPFGYENGFDLGMASADYLLEDGPITIARYGAERARTLVGVAKKAAFFTLADAAANRPRVRGFIRGFVFAAMGARFYSPLLTWRCRCAPAPMKSERWIPNSKEDRLHLAIVPAEVF